jgi:hypothetical protein
VCAFVTYPISTLLCAIARSHSYAENHRNGQQDQVPLLIKRDRNHPSVVIWSICNEVLCNTNDNWVTEALGMKALMHSLDPMSGRPVSANQNGWVGLSTPLDVQGFDYNTGAITTIAYLTNLVRGYIDVTPVQARTTAGTLRPPTSLPSAPRLPAPSAIAASTPTTPRRATYRATTINTRAGASLLSKHGVALASRTARAY